VWEKGKRSFRIRIFGLEIGLFEREKNCDCHQFD